MPPTETTTTPRESAAFHIIFQREDFPDERAAAEHFGRNWTKRLNEDLGLDLRDEELSAAVPEQILRGGGAVFIFGEWRLSARMEVFDLEAMTPGEESPLGGQRIVRCLKCGGAAHVEGYPLDLKSAHYLHHLVKAGGSAPSFRGCKVTADAPDSPLSTATFSYRKTRGGRRQSAECLYDKLNRVVFRIFIPERERHGFLTAPPAEAFAALADGTKLLRSDGITFIYA